MYKWECPICEADQTCEDYEVNEFEVYCDNCENETYTSELHFIKVEEIQS